MANGLNSVTLIGAVSKYAAKDGKQRFDLTTSIPYSSAGGDKVRENTVWVNVPANMVTVADGQTVLVLGHLHNRSFGSDDNKQWICEVVAETLEILDDKAPHLNRTTIVGRLAKDPDAKFTSDGTPITNLRIISGAKFSRQDGTEVNTTEGHNVITWRALAERCNQYLGVGRQVLVVGSVNCRTYKSQSYATGRATEITAESVDFLGPREEVQSNAAPARKVATPSALAGGDIPF